MPRSTIVPAVMLTVGALLATACTQTTPYRTRTLGYDAGGSAPVVRIASCFAGRAHETRVRCETDPAAAASAVQHRHYEYTDGPAGAPRQTRYGDYYLGVVEFDDQGWFADRTQMEALFGLLDRLERDAGGRHPLMILYAHGWKHNASACDNNVVCFSRLLERMDILERNLEEPAPKLTSRDRSPRPVVGIYVGWRGLSLDAGPLTNLTFWTRKGAAERVGRGGVNELLTRLNDYRRRRNRDREHDKTQLIVNGHSFGGLVIHSALSHALMDRAVSHSRYEERREPSARAADPLTEYDVASSFGDLVVLVNAAFEGSDYEPLFHIATNRCYGPTQRPVLLTVTSSADNATGVAFPLGRRLSTLFERPRTNAQGDSMLRAVGHASRYETHRLTWAPATPPTAREKEPAPEERNCGCPYLEPTTTFDWREFVRDIQASAPPGSTIVPKKENGRRVYDVYGADLRLLGDPKYSANYPYLVVTVDRDIIADHNAIYSERFVKFLHSFFLLHIVSRRTFEADICFRDADVPACPQGDAIPCEESCRLLGGGACSGRDVEGVERAR